MALALSRHSGWNSLNASIFLKILFLLEDFLEDFVVVEHTLIEFAEG